MWICSCPTGSNLVVLLLQAPLIAAGGRRGLRHRRDLPKRAAAESQIAFVLVLSAIWFGCINSAREIVKELPVYLRERAVRSALPAYLAQQAAAACGAVSGAMRELSCHRHWMIDFPGSFRDRLLVLFLAGSAATGMGLAVSAFVTRTTRPSPRCRCC